MPRIDRQNVPARKGSGYPAPFAAPCAQRTRQRLGEAGGLTDFGVNLMRLPPGGWSSQRHWHSCEDEFVYVLEGEITLCEDHGEIVLSPGDAAGWKANGRVGHCLINKTQQNGVYLEVGTRSPVETTVYPDIDMRNERDKNGPRYLRKTGEPHPVRKA